MKICIDPGHGLPDPGALGSMSREADINLAVALNLRDELLGSGVEVIMTRQSPHRIMPSSYGGDLQARCDMANINKADYFISIHCNSAGSPAQGAETYCYKRDTEAEKLANVVQDFMVEFNNTENRGVKTASFYVLRKTAMPAILLEMLFISNPAEEKKLIDPEWQQSFARGLAQTLCNYFNIPFIKKPMKHPIMGKSQATKEQMEKFTHSKNSNAPFLAQDFLDIGAQEGVRGDIAYAQSLIETGYFRFGGHVSAAQNNFCGLKQGDGVGYANFDTPQDGILAQIQHLKAYASKEPLNTPLIDPRFHLVKRGSAPNWEDLNGRWAVPGTSYGESIIDIWKKMLDFNGYQPIKPPPVLGRITQQELVTLINLLEKLLSSLRE